MMMSLSKEADIPVEIVSIILKWFFVGLRRVMLKKADINIFGLFKIKMRPYYRRKLGKSLTNNNQDGTTTKNAVPPDRVL